MLPETKDRYNHLKGMGLCVSCGKRPIIWPRSSVRCLPCLEQNRDKIPALTYHEQLEKNRAKRRTLKAEVFEAYGGAICNCCKESEFQFLTLDHINNDGASHRHRIGYKDIYVWARAAGYPPVLQVLCYNCNMARSKHSGMCPHEIRRGQIMLDHGTNTEKLAYLAVAKIGESAIRDKAPLTVDFSTS